MYSRNQADPSPDDVPLSPVQHSRSWNRDLIYQFPPSLPSPFLPFTSQLFVRPWKFLYQHATVILSADT